MSKRILSTLLAAAMLFALALPTGALANVKRRYVYTANGGSLNMRTSPVSHADNKLQSIPYGAEVLVESYVNNNTWAYVSYNNVAGYVMARYLVTEMPAKKAEPSQNEDASTVSFKGFTRVSYDVLVRAHTPGGYVNLRWAPSMDLAVQEKVNDGSVLHVIAQNHSWAQVENPATGAVGFMLRSFLTEYAFDATANGR
ncbi:MAG: SH3 domain-containing protein [Clostridiales bacterium]|nr:SH3 domain-containing protein [Clostridiales bacterium]